MKGRQIFLDHLGARPAAALREDGRLTDLLIEADAPRPGTIYRARVTRPVKGQGGLFLDTPDGPVYLRGAKGLAQGQSVLVQITGFAEPGKAPPATVKLLFKSRFAIVTPGAPGVNVSRQIRGEDLRESLLAAAHDVHDPDLGGLILRSAAAGATPEELAEDIDAMQSAAAEVAANTDPAPARLAEGDGAHVLAWRDWVAPAQIETAAGAFRDHGILDDIAALSGPRVDLAGGLAGGASMYVEPTRALVAVDVNTGADASFAAGLKANFAAARDLPRQLRLRGLGGQIVLDLAPMPKKDRRAFETALRAAFRADAVDTALVGWTPLGHYELQRARVRLPLTEGLP